MLPFLALATVCFAPDFALDFMADAESAGQRFEAARDASRKALARGDLAAAQKLFLDAVPESERKAAHYFVLGNLWFDLDPAFSFQMHERAATLAPGEQVVLREWAIELQRAGRWADAEPVFAKARVGDADEDASCSALRAECLLRLGRTAEACAAWQESRAMVHPQHKRELFAWVHGPESVELRRSRWLAELDAKHLEHVEDLLLADVFYELEGKHYEVRYEYMQHDGQRIAKLLAADDERLLDLTALVDSLFLDWEQGFPKGGDSTPRKNLLEHAAQRKWIGDGARLPAHPRVAREMLAALVRHAQPAAQLLASHRAELLRRVDATPSDTVALETLVDLARAAKDPALAAYEKRLPSDARGRARAGLAAAREAKTPLATPLVNALYAEFEHAHMDLAFVDATFHELGALAPAPR